MPANFSWDPLFAQLVLMECMGTSSCRRSRRLDLARGLMQEVLMEPFFCAARGLGGAHAGALDVLEVSTLLMHEVSTLYVPE